MPVSPATVRDAFVRQEPVAPDDPPAPGTDAAGDAATRTTTRMRRVLLACACVAAFFAGFAGVTLLMRDADSAAKPRRVTSPTSTAPVPAVVQAPAPSAPAEVPTSAPPPSVLVAGEAGSAVPTTSPPTAAPAPPADNAGPPAPSTSVPPTTTPPSTSTPTTTSP